MPKCERIRRRKRQPCIGDLDTLVYLENRTQTPPQFGTVDFTEEFTPASNGPVWALVNTVRGKEYFDETGVGTQITHEMVIRFDETITDETWIRMEDGRRIDILNFEDLDERHEWLYLQCTDKGKREASKV